MVIYTTGDIGTLSSDFWWHVFFFRCQEGKALVLCFLSGLQMTSCFTLTTKQTGGISINWMMTTKRPAYALSPRRLVNQHGGLEEVLIHVTQMAMGTCWLFMVRYEWLLKKSFSYVVFNSQQEDLLDCMTALLKFNCFLSTTVATQSTFESSPWWFITSHGQHKLCYCTLAYLWWHNGLNLEVCSGECQSFRTLGSFAPRQFVPRLRRFVPTFDQFVPNPLADLSPTNYDTRCLKKHIYLFHLS